MEPSSPCLPLRERDVTYVSNNNNKRFMGRPSTAEKTSYREILRIPSQRLARVDLKPPNIKKLGV